MRYIHLAVLISGALLLPGRSGAQGVPGAVTVRPSGGEPARVATPPRTAPRELPDDRSPARRNPTAAARATSSVTLMLVPSLPSGAEEARAVIFRRARQNPQNVILVTRATTASDLNAAIAALFNSRRGQGDVIERDMMARIAPAAAVPRETAAGSLAPARDSAEPRSAPRPSTRRNIVEAERQLSMLRTAPTTHVEGVGSYPARVVRLARLRQ